MVPVLSVEATDPDVLVVLGAVVTVAVVDEELAPGWGRSRSRYTQNSSTVEFQKQYHGLSATLRYWSV